MKMRFLHIAYIAFVTLILVGCGGGGGGSSPSDDTPTANTEETVAVVPEEQEIPTIEDTTPATDEVVAEEEEEEEEETLLGGGGGGSTVVVVPPAPDTAGGGLANKGPFRKGSKVVAYQLDATGNRTGTSVETNTTDDKGTFIINLGWSGATELIVTGDYLDEDTGEYLSGGELSAILNMKIGVRNKTGVNLLTTIAAGGTKKKMAEGKGVDEAKGEASDAVEKLFDIKLDAGGTLEELDVVSRDKDGNAQLLRFSAAFTKLDDPAEVLGELVDGLDKDGELGEEGKAALEEVKEKAKDVDPVEVVENLKDALGAGDGEIPDLGEADGTLSWNHNINFDNTEDAFRETLYISNEVTVSGIVGDSAPISIVGGKYSIDSGDFSDIVGEISNGQLLRVEVNSSSEFEQTTTATLKIGTNNIEIPYSVTTQADPFVADRQPNRFGFGVKRKVAVGTPVTSQTINITGINVPVPISIEGGLYDINNSGNFTGADGIIYPDDNLTIQHISASDYKTKTVTTITISEGSDARIGKFKSKTVAKDVKPDRFKFAKRRDVEKSTVVESETVTIEGINAPATVSIKNGEYKVGSRAWTSDDGEIRNGFELKVRHTSASEFKTEKESFVTVGKRVVRFFSKTKADPRGPADRIPDKFKFETQTKQPKDTSIESNEIVVGGINRDDVAISISGIGAEYSKNGEAYTSTAGTVKPEDKIKVRHTTSSDFKGRVESTLTIGGVSGVFRSVTVREDKKPDVFSFITKEDVDGNSEITSNEINITGINTVVDATITKGTGIIIKNDAESGQSTTVEDGDKIKIKHTASSIQGKKTISTLKVGKVRASFVTITAMNEPRISGTPNSSVAEGGRYSFKPTIDADSGEIVSWSIANKPDWLLFNSRNGKISGHPSNADVGTVSDIAITATNVKGSDSITFDLTVTNVNGAPTIEATPTTRVAQGNVYTPFTPTVIDDDVGDTHTFAIANNPDWMVIDSSTGEVSGTRALTNDDVGKVNGIVITVTDSGGLSATYRFNVIVANTNDAPTIAGTPATTVAENSPYPIFVPTVTDADVGDTESFTITNKPSWATFDMATGALSGTPTADDIGTTPDIVITVMDGAGATAELPAFSIEVTNVNDAPSIFGLPTSSINEGEDYTFTPTVVDIDAGDTKSFTVSGNPAWLTIDASSGKLSGSNAVVGVYGMTITVTDSGGLSDTLSFTLTVLNVNEAPVLTPVSDISIDEDNNGTVTLSATDPDGDEIFFSVDLNDTRVIAEVVGTTLTLTPELNFNGVISAKVRVSDGILDANSTFILTINPVDDAPVLDKINDDKNISIIEDGNISFEVNATDVEGDAITYSAVASNTEAVGIEVSGSTVTISAKPNFTGETDVTVTATANGLTDSKTVHVTITPINDAPILEAIDDIEFDEDHNLTIDLNATDVDGDGVSYDANSSDESIVTVAVSGNQLILTTIPDMNGDVNISVWATDDSADALVSNIESFALTVLPVNDAPIVYDVNSSTDEENATAITLVATDIDSNLTTLRFTIESNATDGNVSIVNNIATYTPALDFVGTDSFTYVAYDGNLTSNIATVTIEVANINDAPVLADINSTEVDEDAVAFVVELNATDVDGDALTYEANSSDDSIATVSINGNEVTVTPQPNMNGEVTISVTATDGTLLSNLQEFTVNILPINDAPVLSGVPAQNTNEETELVIELNATDVDGDSLTYEANSSDLAKATVAIVDNRLTVTPQLNMTGPVTITLRAKDNNLTSNEETFVLTIINVNDAPTLAVVPQQMMDEDGAILTVELNGTDVDDGDVLTYSAVSADTSKATVTVSGNTISIDSMDDQFGDVNIIASVSDGNGGDANQSFTLTINPVNDAPIVSDITGITVDEDNTTEITLTATDIDTDASDINYSIGDNPTNGTVAIVDNIATYTPNANFAGSDSFTFTAYDGNLSSNVATVSIEVTALNDAPMLAPIDDVVMDEDNATITIDLNVTDVDSDSFTYEINSTDPTKATVVSNNNQLLITPLLNQYGEINITVTANDGTIDSNTEEFTLTINPVNDAPVLAPIPAQNADEDTPTVTLELNATDVDGDAISFDVNSSDDNISTVSVDGTTLTLTPQQNMSGVVTIIVKASDDFNASDIKSFDFTINPINDAPELQVIPNPAPVDEDAEPFVVELNATDIEGDAITYEANSSDNTIATLAISGSQLTITPLANMFGEATISVIAKDANESNVQTFTLTINPVNDAPVLAPIANQEVLEDAVPFDVDLNATDIEGDAISYEVNSSDVSLATVSISGNQLTLTPMPNMNGNVNISVVANDGVVHSNVEVFTLTINPVNDAPQLQSIPNQVIGDDGSPITLELNATDIDGDAISYEATSADTSKVTLSLSGNQLTINPVELLGGEVEVTVTARDTVSSDTTSFMVSLPDDNGTGGNELSLPDGFIYRAINNANVTVETTVDVEGETYTVRLYADYNETANSQFNHKGIVVKINGVSAPTLNIQETYKTHPIVAGVYDTTGQLISVSNITIVDADAPVTVIEMGLDDRGEQDSIEIEFGHNVVSGTYNGEGAIDPSILFNTPMYQLEYRSCDGIDLEKLTINETSLDIKEANFSDPDNVTWNDEWSTSLRISGNEMFIDENQDGEDDIKFKYVGEWTNIGNLNDIAGEPIFNTNIKAYRFLLLQLRDSIEFDENDEDAFVETHGHTPDRFYTSLASFVENQRGGRYFISNDRGEGGIAFADDSNVSSSWSGTLVEVDNDGVVVNANAGTWHIDDAPLNADGSDAGVEKLFVEPNDLESYENKAYKVINHPEYGDVVLRGDYSKAGEEEEFIWFDAIGKDQFLQFLDDRGLPYDGGECHDDGKDHNEPIVVSDLVSGVVNFKDAEGNPITTPNDAFVRIVPARFQNDESGWNGAICKVEDNGNYGAECYIDADESGIREAFADTSETFQMVVFKNHINPEDYHWNCGEDAYKWVGDSVSTDSFASVDVLPSDYQDRSGEQCGELPPPNETYIYAVINNRGEEIETTVEVDGTSYLVKLYADYAEEANAQSNHKGARVTVSSVDTETLSIQSTYVNHNIVAGIYLNNQLLTASTPTFVDPDAPGVRISVDLP